MTKLKEMGIRVPSYAESYKSMAIDEKGNFVEPEVYNKMSKADQAQLKMQSYKVYSMPDAQVFLDILENNKGLMDKAKAGDPDIMAALTSLNKDEKTGEWTIKKGSPAIDIFGKSGEGTIKSSNFMVPIGNPTLNEVGKQEEHIKRGNSSNIGEPHIFNDKPYFTPSP
jgi:hypothetical protein